MTTRWAAGDPGSVLAAFEEVALHAIARAERAAARCKACAHLASSARSSRMSCDEHDLSRERAHIARLARIGRREIARHDLAGLASTLTALCDYA